MEVTVSGSKYIYNLIEGDFVKCGGNSNDDHNGVSGSTCPSNIIVPGTIQYNGKTFKVKSIGGKAFYKCSNIKSITLDDSITRIEASAIDYTWATCELKLPDSLEYLGSWALATSAFPVVYIGPNLQYYEKESFAAIRRLTKYVVSNDNKYLSCDEQGALYNKRKTSLISYPESLSSFTIPETVKTLEAYAFGWGIIESIIIPQSVTSIGEKTFYLTKLKEVVILGNIKKNKKSFDESSLIEQVYYHGSIDVSTTLFSNTPNITVCSGYKKQVFSGIKVAFNYKCGSFPLMPTIRCQASDYRYRIYFNLLLLVSS